MRAVTGYLTALTTLSVVAQMNHAPVWRVSVRSASFAPSRFVDPRIPPSRMVADMMKRDGSVAPPPGFRSVRREEPAQHGRQIRHQYPPKRTPSETFA